VEPLQWSPVSRRGGRTPPGALLSRYSVEGQAGKQGYFKPASGMSEVVLALRHPPNPARGSVSTPPPHTHTHTQTEPTERTAGGQSAHLASLFFGFSVRWSIQDPVHLRRRRLLLSALWN
jgi:hypothetical protein